MKKWSFLILFISLLVLLKIDVYAFPEASEHDELLEEVLFGDKYYSHLKSPEITKKITVLEYASYLSIDQYRGDGSEKLNYLKCCNVKHLPELSDIDLMGIFYGSHRNYTHRGWDFDYPDQQGKNHDAANWPVRKKLLLSSINKIFDFGPINEFMGRNCRQCESFGALVYYIHVFGDNLEATTYKRNDLTIPFAKANASDSNPDILYEIRKHSEILFKNQKKDENDRTYKSFIQSFDVISYEARRLEGSTGGINTDEKFKEYHKYEEEFKELLVAYEASCMIVGKSYPPAS